MPHGRGPEWLLARRPAAAEGLLDRREPAVTRRLDPRERTIEIVAAALVKHQMFK